MNLYLVHVYGSEIINFLHGQTNCKLLTWLPNGGLSKWPQTRTFTLFEIISDQCSSLLFGFFH